MRHVARRQCYGFATALARDCCITDSIRAGAAGTSIKRSAPAVTVVLDEGERIVGFMASNTTSISQLHVRVGCHGPGIGRACCGARWPRRRGRSGSTPSRNARARRFYERNGFVAVAFGFEPLWQLDDVRYEWRRRPMTVLADPNLRSLP